MPPRPAAAGQALTAAELSALALVAQGLENAEIGRALFLATDTVKSRVARTLVKLGVRNRAHAVSIALREGLLAWRLAEGRWVVVVAGRGE